MIFIVFLLVLVVYLVSFYFIKQLSKDVPVFTPDLKKSREAKSLILCESPSQSAWKY
ncbi:hypothetical protein [Clostridium sp.]|jgi:regulatory protein YycI of two-component signal transduction system YycFG|uniref:hypothetical protein n=1 Tax=Clostridium sp. TaxID=1506 RepID=UPI00258DA360|nr:hypothetical protein [Clostridium sp.]MDF2503520.1 hypothetical protein [Clostridium sp.]